MINEKYKKLYEDLLRETDAAWRLSIPDREKTESCYKISMRCWTLVRQVPANHPFVDEREEIAFFKTVKPLFTGRLEYYTMVYRYLLFCPQYDPAGRVAFIEKEYRKIRRFREEHAEFIDYLAGGATCKDAEYFRQREEGEKEAAFMKIYDGGKFSAPQDGVLALLAGYGLYEGFLKGEG